MIAILTVQAAQLIALVVLTIVGWRALRGVLRSLDGMAGTLASVLAHLPKSTPAWARWKPPKTDRTGSIPVGIAQAMRRLGSNRKRKARSDANRSGL
jgi:hypothetical protein